MGTWSPCILRYVCSFRLCPILKQPSQVFFLSPTLQLVVVLELVPVELLLVVEAEVDPEVELLELIVRGWLVERSLC